MIAAARRCALASALVVASAIAAGACGSDDAAPIPAHPNGPGPDGGAGARDGGPDGPAGDPEAADMHARADTAAATMMLQYWQELRTQSNDAYWTYAHDFDVVLDAVERRGPAAYHGAVRMFYEVQDARGWTRDYYDDENWMVLTLVHAYDLTGEQAYLDRAKSLYADIMGAWDETCCGAAKGGIWWRTAHDAKVTAINAGAVISGARLAERTNDPTTLDFAKKVYAFWSANMVDHATGHVFDGVSASTGQINTDWKFTYDEGLMIGAAVALAHATHDASPLALAHTIAAYMIANESQAIAGGTILSDGKCGKPGGDDGEQFKGIAARYLAQLYLADPSHAEYKEFLRRSADAAWKLARDPASGLVSCDWAGPYDPNTDSVNSLSSAAMTLAVTAELLGPAEKRPALELEAEEGDLHGPIGFETTHAGFHGWGYVAGWGADGQWVDFAPLIDVPGDYPIEISYATEPNGASRLVYANGAVVTPDLPLPSTDGYDNWATTTITVPLVAGRNVVSIIFNQGQGSHGYVNLDRVVVKPR